MMSERSFYLEELGRLVAGRLKGDPQLRLGGVGSLERAGPSDIAYVAKGKRVDLSRIRAGALILEEGGTQDYPNCLLVQDPRLAFARVVGLFHPRRRFWEGVHPTAVIAAGCRIDPTASIGPFCTLGRNVSVGKGSEIHAGVVLYDGVVIGSDCLVYSRVVIREGTTVGSRVIIHPGAVIGSDGFGFGREADGTPVKIPQVGRVVIGDDCEIGANTCIDRSTLEETVLASNVKLDNLIQVGHNVVIGSGTAISALSGISGSVRIGENVIMGGQVGIADHVTIADRVMIVAKTGVTGSILRPTVVAGYPYQEFSRWRRNSAIAKNLEGLRERLASLERIISEMEDKK